MEKNRIKELFKELFKASVSIVALVGIFYYLYIRVIVEKLPRNLPTEKLPILSLLLYGWLILVYVYLLIIFPLYLKYRNPQKPPLRLIEQMQKLKKNIVKPFVWLWEYILFIKPTTGPTIGNIGVYLFNYRHYCKLIGMLILGLPRIISGLILLIEILYFNRIYYFYYIILLNLITIGFFVYLLVLEKNFKDLLEVTLKNHVAFFVKLDNFKLESLIKIDVEETILRSTPTYMQGLSGNALKEEQAHFEEVTNIITIMGKLNIIIIIYVKVLKETKLKSIIYLSLWIFLIDWVLALIICILNFPGSPQEALYNLIQDIQRYFSL